MKTHSLGSLLNAIGVSLDDRGSFPTKSVQRHERGISLEHCRQLNRSLTTGTRPESDIRAIREIAQRLANEGNRSFTYTIHHSGKVRIFPATLYTPFHLTISPKTTTQPGAANEQQENEASTPETGRGATLPQRRESDEWNEDF